MPTSPPAMYVYVVCYPILHSSCVCSSSACGCAILSAVYTIMSYFLPQCLPTLPTSIYHTLFPLPAIVLF